MSGPTVDDLLKQVSALEGQADLDRVLIAELQAQGVLDRSAIADLQAQHGTDRRSIGDLEAQGALDRGKIGDLEAQGALDRGKIDNLEIALSTARRIGAAIGILMANHKVTEVQGFELLRLISQNTHRRLREVAEEVVETGTLPSLAITRSALADPPDHATPR